MKQIIKINFPFLKIDFEIQYSKLENMNKLESLIMIMIITSNTTKLKDVTLKDGLKLIYNIQTWTLPIIKSSLYKLISTKNINTDKNPDELLKLPIGSIMLLIPKDIRSSILESKFKRISLESREWKSFIYENLINGLQSIGDGGNKDYKESYSEDWKVQKINIDTINEIIDYLAFEEKSENEIILSTRFNSKKIVYLEHSIEVEKNNFKITPTNKLAEILFNEIENKRINVKILEDKLRTSKSNLTFFNDIVGQEFNEDVEILKIGESQYYIENEKLYFLYNKLNKYKAANIGKELYVEELYSSEITDFKIVMKDLIKNNNLEDLSLFYGPILEKIKMCFIENESLNSDKRFLEKIISKKSSS